MEHGASYLAADPFHIPLACDLAEAMVLQVEGVISDHDTRDIHKVTAGVDADADADGDEGDALVQVGSEPMKEDVGDYDLDRDV